MTTENYFTQLAPQLLGLLDGIEGREVSRVAGFIVSNGILGKRAIGAPGTIGWQLFAEPLLKTFNPTTNKSGRKRKANSDQSLTEKQLVSQAELSLTLRRLSALVESHPNPGLAGRLLRPLVLPLWGLLNYDKSPTTNSELSSIASQLLGAFFKLVGNDAQLILLADNLLFDGTPEWEYGPSSEGGIAVREREKQSVGGIDIIEALPRINRRVATFVEILSSVGDATAGVVFLKLSKQWLLPDSQDGLQKLHVDSDPLKSFSQAKLVEAILEKFQDKISAQPDQLLGLIEQILKQKHGIIKAELERQQGLKKPSYSSLSNIVQQDRGTRDDQFGSIDEGEEVLPVAISLLNTILANSDRSLGKEGKSSVDRIQQLLTELAKDHSRSLSTSFNLSIQSSLSLIKSADASLATTSSKDHTKIDSTAHSVQQTLQQMAEDLSSDLPPMRNSALHALQALIKTTDIPVDVPTIALLVLQTIRTDPEEFVYLAAIRTLVELAMRRDLRFTSTMVADAFQDVKEESDVDGRLRLGECLNVLVEALSEDPRRLGAAENGTVTRGIAEVLVSVAGRRGKRSREMQEHQQKERLEKRRKREAEQAWGGQVPEVPNEEDSIITEKQRRYLESIEKIIKGWEDTGFEEDIRIRTSALSILGQLLQYSLDFCSPSIIQSATDISLSILTLETSPDKGILRRAAVLIPLSILKAMDSANEAGRESAVGLEAGKWVDVKKLLGWIKESDDDDLVREHAEAVIESLEAWRMKRILGARDSVMGIESPNMALEGGLRGLAVNPGMDIDNRGMFKRIEEIE